MNIIIVEISESHEECLYSQLLFLKEANHSVTLLLHPALASQINEYTTLADDVIFLDRQAGGILKKYILQCQLLKRILSYDLVIFNTASSSKTVRNIAFLMNFSKVPCIGVLHNTQRLKNSFTQRIISTKIKKYFVLSDYLAGVGQNFRGVSLASFYPIYFPDYPSKILHKKPHEIWITIPGRMDYSRRDYNLLFKVLKVTRRLVNIKFVFLGKVNTNTIDGRKLLDAISDSNMPDRFLLFPEFISNEVFHNYLRVADYILPLLRTTENYMKHKISGSFNMAFAYKKPLISNSFFDTIPDLKENALFYSPDTLGPLLQAIDNQKKYPLNIYTDLKWSFEIQQSNYLTFIKE